jgi:hypothetical protein
MSIGNWRFYRSGADGTIFSLLIHAGWYICLLSAPFPLMRTPVFFTPRIYSGGLLYMLVINFAMVAVSYHVFIGSDDINNDNINNEAKHLYLTEPVAWLGLSIAITICFVSGGISFNYVPVSHRHKFYKQLTWKQHLATYHWNDKTFTTDHHHREVNTQEGVRALLGIKYPLLYLPKDEFIEFYKNNWAGWVADPPEWFDADFRSMIPRELLVEVPSILWEEVEETQEGEPT